MIKNSLAVATVSFGTLLAGCNSVDLASIIAKVQMGANTACQFVPTAETITSIVVDAAFPAATPITAIVSSIVNQICNIKASAALRDHPGAAPMEIVVNGKTVVIHGYDTRMGRTL